MKILITESKGFSRKALEALKSLGSVTVLDIKNKLQLIKEIEDVDVVFIRLRFMIDKDILQKASKLKYILTATTGLDHIDVNFFKSQGGSIIALKDEYEFLATIPSTAEHTWALLLALVRHIPYAVEDVKKGFWRRDLFKGHNIKGKKLGILGYGRVGQQVSKYGQAFGMQVGHYDKKEITSSISKLFKTPQMLFEWADIISIHIPAEHNLAFVNTKLLSYLKKDALLINTSRGSVIDEKVLATFIKEKKLFGCAVDVLHNEFNNSIKSNELVQLMDAGYNIIITPHIAGATYESMQMTEEFITHKFESMLNQ